MTKTGAQILWECIEREGVKHVFGSPGGAILPAYDALKHSKIHHVLVRHEQGATHMADGYARASGQVGVAVATSGPGATNMVTGIATAMMDSSPIVCITGQVGSKLIGSDAFQETDITGVTLPITKHNYVVSDVNKIASTVREAFYIARSGRPAPVLVDITKDAQQATTVPAWSDETVRLPGYRRHRGDGGGDRNRQVLRHRLPFDAMGGEGARGERPRGEPHRFPCRVPRLPHSEALPRASRLQGEGRHQGRDRRDAGRDRHGGEVQEGAPAHGEGCVGGIQGQQLPELPQLPPVHARGAEEAEGVRPADAPAGARGQGDLHRLPQGRRARRADGVKFCYSGSNPFLQPRFATLRSRHGSRRTESAGRAARGQDRAGRPGRAPELGDAPDGGRFRAGDGPALHPLYLK